MNVHKQDVYFRWNLISADPDDDKFVDVAVASSANYLVSNDKHFNVLEGIKFPSVACIKAEEFLEFCL